MEGDFCLIHIKYDSNYHVENNDYRHIHGSNVMGDSEVV